MLNDPWQSLSSLPTDPRGLDDAPTLHVTPAPATAPAGPPPAPYMLYQPAPVPPAYAPPAYAPYPPAPQPQYAPPPQYPAPQWTPPPSAPYGQLPGPASRPRRRALPLALLIGVVVLAGIGFVAIHNLCCALPPAQAAAESYFSALKSQDYAAAYSYIDPRITIIMDNQSQPISLSLFTQAARAYDQQRGTISSFSLTKVSVTGSGSSSGSADITVRVTRGTAAPYDVHLQLGQEGNDWKIIGFDNL